MYRSEESEKKFEISISRLEAIAEKFGTPTFILDLPKLERNIGALKNALNKVSAPTKIFYSVKTNYLPVILSKMQASGCGADVVSGYEMKAALAAGFHGKDIVFNGPMKTAEELREAVSIGALINIDGLEEAEEIQRIGAAKGIVIPVGLRVNPGWNMYPSADPSFNVSSTRNACRSKFGWLIKDGAASRAADRIQSLPNLRLSAVHCHLGSQITSVEAFHEALSEVFLFVRDLPCRSQIEVINIGGGFGVPGIHRDRSGALRNFLMYSGSDVIGERRDEFQLEDFTHCLNDALHKYQIENITIACEPGRILVSDSMTLLTSVVSVKQSSASGWVVLDGGLNIMPTAGPLEDHYMSVANPAGRPMKDFMVGGPMCYEGDVFSYAKKFPIDIRAGELVLIQDAGAYTVSRSTNFIRARGAVVAIDGLNCYLCWRRESYDDIFSFQEPLLS